MILACPGIRRVGSITGTLVLLVPIHTTTDTHGRRGIILQNGHNPFNQPDQYAANRPMITNASRSPGSQSVSPSDRGGRDGGIMSMIVLWSVNHMVCHVCGGPAWIRTRVYCSQSNKHRPD